MKPTNDDLRQLLDLPDEIASVGRQINGMKSEKVKKVRSLEGMEARHRISISKTGGYSNAEDRKAALTMALEDDPKYMAVLERVEALDGMIRAADEQKALLRRKRAGIQTQSGLHIVGRLEELIKDKELVAAIGSGLLA